MKIAGREGCLAETAFQASDTALTSTPTESCGEEPGSVANNQIMENPKQTPDVEPTLFEHKAIQKSCQGRGEATKRQLCMWFCIPNHRKGSQL